MENPIREWTWQEYALCIAMAVMLLLELGLFNSFQSLPSPLYGGDVYYHFSVINHIANGESPLMSSQFIGVYAHYPWIFHLTVALLSIITGASALSSAIYSPMLTTFLAGIISWHLGKRIFHSKTFALLFSLCWISWQIPHAAASPFAELVIWPLFVLAVTFAESPWQRALAGVTLGLCGLSQVVLWVAAFMYLGLLMASRIILSHVHKGENGRWSIRTEGALTTIISQIKWFLPIVLVGLPIGLLYWGPGIFVYHGVTPNRWADYVAAGDSVTLSAIFDMIKHLFFFTRNWATLLISIISIFGTYWAIKKHPRFEACALNFAVAVIGFLHPIITLPLLGSSIGYYAFGYIFDLGTPLMFVLAVYLVYRSVPESFKAAVYAIGLILVIANAYFVYSDYDKDIWTQQGRNPNMMMDLALLMKEKISNDEAMLVTHEETGFAINAMTGKKVTIARRTHASPFVDMNKRIADTAIMLYGKNNDTIRELLNNHSVRYLYEDHYSAEQEAACKSQKGNLAANPDISFSCLRTSPAYADYLSSNGIEYVKVHGRIDPASNVAPKFDMLAIIPGNYTYIQSHLKSLQGAQAQGQLIQRWSEITTE